MEQGGAIDLVKAELVNLNNGMYLEEDIRDKLVRTKFCIGVAGYPERHFEAPNLDIDLNNLKERRLMQVLIILLRRCSSIIKSILIFCKKMP